MIRRRKFLARAVFVALLFIAAPSVGHAAEKPKVRAVTAFVRIDRANYRQQVGQALVVLRRAKAALEKAGYEVQSIRVTTQRFPEYTRGLSKEQAVAFFREYDQFAKKEGFAAAIGPAMLTDNDDPAQAELLGEILLNTTELNASLVVAGAAEIHWNNVRAAAKLIKTLSERSPGGIANFNFAATAAIPEYTPFFPGSYHLGPGRHFSIALQSANVVAEAFASARSFADAGKALETALGAHAKAIESVATRIAQDTGWTYEGIDLSPAPLKEVSIGAAMERLTRAKFGSSGTMTAAAIVTSALRAIPVKKAGYSGLMVPVLEDATLAERWSDGTLTLDALLAYSAVCGTGLDTIPLPGSITTEQLERIIGDMASLAVKWSKPLSARLMPVAGKKPGDRTEFNDPFLVNARIHPLP